MIITDTQVHIWEVDRPGRPWPARPGRPPHKPHGFSAEEMLVEMDAAGIDRAIIVPPHWVGDDNRTALEVAARYPTRFGVVGRIDLKGPDAPAELGRWLDEPHMLGVRATFHTRPFVDWLDDGSLEWFWTMCEQLAIPIMALVPGMVRKLIPVAARHPDLTLVIPHMGCPLDTRGRDAFATIDDLLGLAHHPRVVLMVSSVPCFSNEAYPFRDLHPFLERIFDAYGPRRLLWGADRSRLTSTYRECLDLFREALKFLSSEDKEWILGKAVTHVFRWPE